MKLAREVVAAICLALGTSCTPDPWVGQTIDAPLCGSFAGAKYAVENPAGIGRFKRLDYCRSGRWMRWHVLSRLKYDFYLVRIELNSGDVGDLCPPGTLFLARPPALGYMDSFARSEDLGRQLAELRRLPLGAGAHE